MNISHCGILQKSAGRKAPQLYRLAAFLTLALLFLQPSRAATPVCGTVVDGHWTKANSPYLVTCDILVAGLTIDADVHVLFEGNYVFEVAGVLKVNGTSDGPVVFTSTNGGWQGVFFNFSSPGSELIHCTIMESANSGLRIIDSTPRISKCVIANNASSGEGGGIDARNSAGELVLVDCTITNNVSASHGGGVNALMTGGRLSMEGCFIGGNFANPSRNGISVAGGGIRAEGNVSLRNCIISENVSTACAPELRSRESLGGGIYLNGDATLKNCIIRGNRAATYWCGPFYVSYGELAYGGGVYLNSGSFALRNCIVSDNATSAAHASEGSGIYVSSAAADIVNCTIARNANHGLHVNEGSVSVRNSILYFNNNNAAQIAGTATVNYSDVQSTNWPGTGNINRNPVFQSPTNLIIVSGSPCSDVGDPDPMYNDLCFPPSLGTPRNDMGAHGGPGGCCWDRPCDCPVLGQLHDQTTCAGMNLTLCIPVAGAEPISYQWRYHGTNATNPPVNINDATNACLTLSVVQANNAGYYSVRVSNPFCNAESNPALLLVFPVCYSLDLYPGLSITGQLGRTYCIRFATNLSGNVWTPLTNFTLTTTPTFFYLDPTAARYCDGSQGAGPPRRFYSIVEGPCP